jgi:hypothetical protein
LAQPLSTTIADATIAIRCFAVLMRATTLLIVRGHLRRGFARFEFGADLLDLRRLLLWFILRCGFEKSEDEFSRARFKQKQ